MTQQNPLNVSITKLQSEVVKFKGEALTENELNEIIAKLVDNYAEYLEVLNKQRLAESAK